MIDRAKEIFDGWYNWLHESDLSADQKRVAAERLKSCYNCQYKKERWLKKVIGKVMDFATGKEKSVREKTFTGFKCRICSCPLDQKTLSWASRCPLPEYNNSSYLHPQRWGEVFFDDQGILRSPDAIYHTEPN